MHPNAARNANAASSCTADRADLLSDVLQDLRLARVVHGRQSLTAPGTLRFAARTALRFHFAIEGEWRLRTAEGGWQRLRAGDVALLPRGHAHALAVGDAADLTCGFDEPLPPPGGGPVVCRQGAGGAAPAQLFWCEIALDGTAPHPLLQLMPDLLRIDCAACSDPALPVLIELMAGEARGSRPGAPAVLARMADVVIARIVRAWFEAQCGAGSGWLAAARDPRLARALAAIHRHPGRPWPVAALAQVAQSSRSVFAERFATVMGMPPARYVARWRMYRAAELLRGGDLTVSQVAHRLGYDSVASFSRAFKRTHGRAPGDARAATVGV